MPKIVCAEDYLSAVLEFSSHYGYQTELREIHFIDVDVDTIRVIQSAFAGRLKGRNNFVMWNYWGWFLSSNWNSFEFFNCKCQFCCKIEIISILGSAETTKITKVITGFTIEVRGVSSKTTVDSVEFYFDNKRRSGGDGVTNVRQAKEDGAFYVTFNNEEGDYPQFWIFQTSML